MNERKNWILFPQRFSVILSAWILNKSLATLITFYEHSSAFHWLFIYEVFDRQLQTYALWFSILEWFIRVIIYLFIYLFIFELVRKVELWIIHWIFLRLGADVKILTQLLCWLNGTVKWKLTSGYWMLTMLKCILFFSNSGKWQQLAVQ